MRFWLPIAVVAFIACCIGIYYYFSDPYASRLLQFRVNDVVHAGSIPDELDSARYLLDRGNRGGMYQAGELTYADYAESGSVVEDVAYAGDTEAKLLYTPLTREYEVRVEGSVVFSTSEVVRGLFISPDGTQVGIAALTSGGVSGEPGSWMLRGVSVPSGEEWSSPGFAGVFLENDELLVFRDYGIVTVDVKSGAEVVVSDSAVTAAHTSVVYERESSRVAFGTIAGRVFVYELIREPALALLPVGEFEDARGTIALTSENVYVVAEHADGGTRITRYSIFSGETDVVRTLPKILALKKLLP